MTDKETNHKKDQIEAASYLCTALGNAEETVITDLLGSQMSERRVGIIEVINHSIPENLRIPKLPESVKFSQEEEKSFVFPAARAFLKKNYEECLKKNDGRDR